VRLELRLLLLLRRPSLLRHEPSSTILPSTPGEAAAPWRMRCVWLAPVVWYSSPTWLNQTFDDIRLIVGMPRANLQELQSPTPVIPRGVGLFFVPASIFGHHAAPLL
jgi:hypothetical protein